MDGEKILDDSSLIEKKITSEEIFHGKLLHVLRDAVELPDGRRAMREWITHPGAAAVLPITEDGEVILVRQYRYPIGCVTLEMPAGKLDVKGEAPLECAKRELKEETGYEAADYEFLTCIATTVGFTDEKIYLYLAKNLTAGEQHLDSDEFINVVKMPLTEAVRRVETGEIYDSKTVIAILMTAKRQSEFN